MKNDPVATYRVQLRPGFGFDDAAELVPYLADLGIGYVYTSPYLQAAKGSQHGYDVVDPSRVNDELGGPAAHSRMIAAIADAGLSHMIDIVPNHMAIDGGQNPWWWDVLENGPSSEFAIYFDVDWEATEERWPNKVLLPILGDHYGRVLEAGEIALHHEGGGFTLRYFDHSFPVDPSSLADLLAAAADISGSELLGFLAESCARLPRPTATGRQAVHRRHRDKAAIGELLVRVCDEDAAANKAIDDQVRTINEHVDALDALVDAQNYRLAYWRTAGRDLGYRRFFDINSLAGLRVEEQDVFDATHRLVLSMAHENKVQGFRIDHPDGLRDPLQYAQRLRGEAPEAWIVMEKILEPGETLPRDWPVQGTTGYDFLNVALGVSIDPESEEQFTQFYSEFTESETPLPEMILAAKRLVLNESLGGDLSRLTALFVQICERHRRYRDFTRHDLREALRAAVAFFPVYRTYIRAALGAITDTDRAYIEHALDAAKADRTDLDPELFDFLGRILRLEIRGDLEDRLVMRFQQLTGPAIAKGVEDTVFYRFNRFAGLNEVGGHPEKFGTPVAEFHAFNAANARDWPHTMLCSSTHDTKRSEDVRARMAALSEVPDEWIAGVRKWSTLNEKHRSGDTFDRNTEYLFYQTLFGAWPIDETRMIQYMEKAAREAKEHTSWTDQNSEYEDAMRAFVTGAMADKKFLAAFEQFTDALILPGRINSLAALVLKLTSPGVPDIYQGTELWDLSLVDPDNRRPVNFKQRTKLLAELDKLDARQIVERMDEGLPKLHVVRETLRLRRAHPECFGEGSAYTPLAVTGTKSDHAIAYLRGESILTVVPRLPIKLAGDWKDTALQIPAGKWRNVYTNAEIKSGEMSLSKIMGDFPVAVLAKE